MGRGDIYMNKVVRIYLISEHKDKNGEIISYQDINKLLWELQRQTRTIKNKTIQYCWEYQNFSSDYYKEHHAYPSEKEILSYTLDGYVNDKLKNSSDLYSVNRSSTIRNAIKEFKNAKADMIKGVKSIISYKSDQPLSLHNQSVRIEYIGGQYFANIKLVNSPYAKEHDFASTMIRFKFWIRDKSAETIIQRCLSNEYKISESEMFYDRKKNKWYINLCYSFSTSKNENLDSNKILGVDLGIACPLCASVYGDYARFTIHGGEIEKFRRTVEARKLSMLKQGKNCGEGRIGHGIKCRNKPAYNISDKIARFRDTINHKYSKALIDYALKNNCGVIQMEELTGITADADRFLKNWTYYDLQTKIKYKAEENGIKFKLIKPKYTSQRCSKCGYIDKENRKTQAHFLCLKCGFECNADYNASQNISIENIDMIIEQELKSDANIGCT